MCQPQHKVPETAAQFLAGGNGCVCMARFRAIRRLNVKDLWDANCGPEVSLELLLLQGHSLYVQEKYDMAQEYFVEALKRDSHCEKAKEALMGMEHLVKADKLFASGQYQGAIAAYTYALQLDRQHSSYNAKLHCRRAEAFIKLDKLQEALVEFKAVHRLQPDSAEAISNIGQLEVKLGQFDSAVKTFEELQRKHPTEEHEMLLQEAKLALKMSKDYYIILGVSKSATDDEIRKAYKKKAMLHHPDKHSNATQEEKKKEEKAFKHVYEAYSVLIDSQKRREYDSRVDSEDNA